ncbi:hypothetical protein [Specibacter sp. NPDC078709]|uniref:hypothetical protein n=1 Tax=Specibacter sp. NPDC078709 TaxID=3154364 RepID=UPI00343F3C13
MQRVRNLSRWNVDCFDYESPELFFGMRTTSGAHAIQYNGQILDLLVKDRGSSTTLVVFSGALSSKAKHTPAFGGRALAEDTGVNLIAVADPSMNMGEITVAWYLGNSHTGPLRSVLSDLIRHVVVSLGGTRTIMFGGSGGGFAAAHLAHDFPDSIALICNPRLSLERWSERPLRKYFNNCHNRLFSGQLTDDDRQFLAPYGPIEISALKDGPFNHDLLIYHNLLDPWFLNLQLFPFLEATPEDSRLKLQFSMDKLGHGGIPAHQVRRIVSQLAQDIDTESAIISAGFLPRHRATNSALLKYPDVAFSMQKTEEEYEQIQLRLNESKQQQKQAVMTASIALDKQKILYKRALDVESSLLELEEENVKLRSDNSILQRSVQSLKNKHADNPYLQIQRKLSRFSKYFPNSLKRLIIGKILTKDTRSERPN